MNKTEKTKLKETLEKIREDVVGKIKHIEKENFSQSQREASGDLSGHGLHMADVASDSFERELSLGLAANERVILREIDDALHRLEDKDFGNCQECGKTIGIKRLSAVPYALMCIKCKEAEEKKTK